jgi:hypothetical protein
MTLISQKYIDDNDLVARYLAESLSDVERQSFEAYYLEHPELVKELDRTAQFKSGLMELKELGELGKLVNQRSLSYRSGIAIAASLLVAISVGVFWFYQHRELPILAASAAALGTQFQSIILPRDSYQIQRTRTSSYDATIKLPSKPSAIELRIKPETTSITARYRITISANDSAIQIAETDNLQPAHDGFVSVYLNASSLSPAIYELKIFGDGDTNEGKQASSFLVEVLAAENR